ncbi:MAG: hypothetical protein N0C86_01770, partial [Candidatus Thiodiazotropha taylori]|nr:hypothetical protein [Candidatus Thiodiazotropha taylori]MCW4324703.1 hypothetical protein [Candidatus Thiodiazotropha taylori]
KHHSALLVAHLEQPKFAPRALIGAFSGATGRIGLVLTGPRNKAPSAASIVHVFIGRYERSVQITD